MNKALLQNETSELKNRRLGGQAWSSMQVVRFLVQSGGPGQHFIVCFHMIFSITIRQQLLLNARETGNSLVPPTRKTRVLNREFKYGSIG